MNPKLKRGLKWGSISLAVIIIVAYFFVSYMIASGLTKYDRRDQEDNPSSHGLEYEEVEFASRDDDITLGGWYLPGENDKPTIIFVHGIGSTRSGNNMVAFASKMVDRGYNILMFDMRGHGTSGGDRVSGGYYEQQDVLGAYDYLIARGISSDSIGLLGVSMGAGTGILAAAQEPGIKALVADSTYAKVSNLLSNEASRKTKIPKTITPVFIPTVTLMAKLFYGISIGSLVPEDAVHDLDYPILVIHGMADSRIDYSHGERVYNEAKANSDIWLIPDVDHVDAFLDYPEEYVKRVDRYFTNQLD